MKTINFRGVAARLAVAMTPPAVLMVMLVVVAAPARAQDVCRDAAAQQDHHIRSVYGAQIDFWIRIADALRAKGVNPAAFPQAMPNGTVEVLNIPWMISTLATQRDSGLGAVFQSFHQCASGYAPYQQIINVGVFYATGGLSQVLPRAATHVDASQILSGKPLGGPNALIPKARDDALNRLGIGGDVAKVIRNPRCIFGC